jgi:hypothetical protein
VIFKEILYIWKLLKLYEKIIPQLFLIHLITRIILIFLTGFYNNYAFQPDSWWLVNFADQALNGNFNLELKRFIASTLFPMVCSFFKLFFINNWDTALIIFQLLLASLSGVLIFHITNLLFKDNKISFIASILYALFTPTLYFVHTFSQEILFQSLFIFTIYFFLKSLTRADLKYVIASVVFFSLSYLFY